jgi:hypothetical protein
LDYRFPQPSDVRFAPIAGGLLSYVKYHQGKGEIIRTKKGQIEMGRPKVNLIDVVAAHESGSARTM